ncbi:hypothetical protein Pint_30839 [Pistacia integerrima]|uniref:Uncharacterized protein n=1 Tax=Pistacia integerrima TaxID=434235 RepID=A0ACC0XQN1_9ROSI|nr:hypothetical protein Pint_30839 [Pistacia integerrima]
MATIVALQGHRRLWEHKSGGSGCGDGSKETEKVGRYGNWGEEVRLEVEPAVEEGTN